jgi:hypothetical protein
VLFEKAVIDHTFVCRALTSTCCTVNLLNVLDLFVAHSHLGATSDKVWQTLLEHCPSIGQANAIGQNAHGPNLSRAKTFRDIERRLSALLRKRYGPSENGGPLTERERREESELHAQYIDIAQQIECPPGYSYRNAREDSDRLHRLFCKRLSPPSTGGGELTGAEDDEEAILTARAAAYWRDQQWRFGKN